MKTCNWFFLFLVSCFLLSVFTGCSKRDKLLVSTLGVTISPSSATVTAGLTQVFSVAVKDNKSSAVTDAVTTWGVTGGIGTVSPTTGASITFTAGSSGGTGTVTTITEGVIASANVTVTSTGTGGGGGGGGATSYVIYADAFATDLNAPGAFWGVGDSIVLSADTTNKSEGTQSFKANFTVTGGGWAGWFVDSASTKNMSAYNNGNLKFDIKTAYDIQIGIRSNNINSGTNTAKKYISSYITLDGATFKSVSIPISALVSAQAGTDLTQMKDMFISAAVGSQIGAQANKDYWIDNIRWTTD